MITCTRSAGLVDTNNLYLGSMFRGQCLVNIQLPEIGHVGDYFGFDVIIVHRTAVVATLQSGWTYFCPQRWNQSVSKRLAMAIVLTQLPPSTPTPAKWSLFISNRSLN